MNPQLLRAIAVERMDEIAREAEERRRGSDARRQASAAAARRNGHKPIHRSHIPEIFRRLQPGS